VSERTQAETNRALNQGEVVFVRYRDHVLFKDANASDYQPWTRETVGWLDQVGDDYVRIVWERYWDKTLQPEARLRSTGISICKRDIVELWKVA